MPKRPKKSKDSPPETADEFLAAGVAFEEAAEKWRAGDAAKSLRFYDRAWQTYTEALERWPQNFDISYNRYVLPYFCCVSSSL